MLESSNSKTSKTYTLEGKIQSPPKKKNVYTLQHLSYSEWPLLWAPLVSIQPKGNLY